MTIGLINEKCLLYNYDLNRQANNLKVNFSQKANSNYFSCFFVQLNHNNATKFSRERFLGTVIYLKIKANKEQFTQNE